LDFVIDEIGSALGNRNTPPDYDLSASVGTSIWTVDWMLNAMAMVRVATLLFQMLVLSTYLTLYRMLVASTCSKAGTLPSRLGAQLSSLTCKAASMATR
jgi:hypothetical protein